MADLTIAIQNIDDFEKWGANQPIKWTLALAFRTALRILPFIIEFDAYGTLTRPQKSRVYLTTFRALHLCWASLNFPGSIPPVAALRAARAADRIVGQAATVSGAAGAAQAAYAAADVARAAGNQDREYAIRSLENALNVAAEALSSAPSLLWDELSSDAADLLEEGLGEDSAMQIVLNKKIWRANRDSWPRLELAKFEHTLRRNSNGVWRFWLVWYSARSKGTSEYNLSSYWLEEISTRISREDDGWWDDDYDVVNKKIESWIAEAKLDPDARQKTIAESIKTYLEEKRDPASVKEIVAALSKLRNNIVPKSVRGDLSRLASSGQIKRVTSGIYQSAKVSTINVDDIGPIEAQTRGAVQFVGHDSAPIEVVRRASTGELRSDLSARKRHSEVLRRADGLLARYSRSERGGNVSSAVVDEVSLFRSSLGASIDEVDPDLLIPRGDGLRRDLAAHQDKDDFSKLAPIPDDLLLSLGKLVSDYNNFISYDPELARRDEALLGPDAKRKLVPPAEGQRVLENAVSLNAASQNVVAVLSEEAKVAPAIPDPENRQSRRYSEGAKNFARIAMERATDFAKWAWNRKAPIVASGGFAYAAAKWVLANQLWLLKYFSSNPVMLDIIGKLLRVLQSLPLG